LFVVSMQGVDAALASLVCMYLQFCLFTAQ